MGNYPKQLPDISRKTELNGWSKPTKYNREKHGRTTLASPLWQVKIVSDIYPERTGMEHGLVMEKLHL